MMIVACVLIPKLQDILAVISWSWQNGLLKLKQMSIKSRYVQKVGLNFQVQQKNDPFVWFHDDIMKHVDWAQTFASFLAGFCIGFEQILYH